MRDLVKLLILGDALSVMASAAVAEAIEKLHRDQPKCTDNKEMDRGADHELLRRLRDENYSWDRNHNCDDDLLFANLVRNAPKPNSVYQLHHKQ